jgi:UDP-N-acetylglucosamine--N-acetylmuramyl-(pentapeptide) pyrophosphoryl-undecaprenol N-acetylglucosamine transferase
VQILIPSLICLLALVALAIWASWRWARLAEREPRVILTGGGTGGHVNPALAIAEGIRKRKPDTRFLYVGVRGKAESVIVRRAGYRLSYVTSEGFPGLRLSPRSIRFLLRLCVGIVQSVVILFRFAPRWVIATGGYVSAPIILAALILRFFRLGHTKVFLHEQNSIPGQLNAVLGRWVDRVLLTFPQTLSFFPRNGVVVGYPVRHSILQKPCEEAKGNLGFKIPEGRQVVFAFGGSQGSRTINRAVVDSLPALLRHRDKIFIIHGMGLCKSREYDAAADTESRLRHTLSPDELALLDGFYYRQDYFHNIADVYSVSDLIVCRSGAGSLNEISRVGKPSILIPKANLPGDHQVMNARAMKHAGAAEVLFEDTFLENGEVLEKLDGEVLTRQVLSLLQDRDRMNEMASKAKTFLRRHAIERILSEIHGDRSFNNGVGCDAVPFKPLLSNQRLLQVLTVARDRMGACYDPLQVVGDPDDLSYYRHRASGLLSHDTWQDRNLGVKLIGLTHHREKIPTLLHMLADRTPAHFINRCFGGDFRQVGFIRRNIVHALQVMNHFDSEVERHLLMAMEDGYFEVRSQACCAVAHFGPCLAGKEIWLRALFDRLEDRCFEVVIAAVCALGEVGMDGHAWDILLGLRDNHYWQVRDAALKGLKRLLERRVIRPSPALLSEVGCFVLTATDFRPHFSIKETYKIIQKCCCEDLANETAGSTSTDVKTARKR